MGLYIRPDLAEHGKDLGFFRIGGAGLANCMYVAARAYILSKKLNCPMMRPTWERFGIGQFIRHEKDKRHYHGLFKQDGLLCKLRNIWLRISKREIAEGCAEKCSEGVVRVFGLRRFFVDLVEHQDLVREYFDKVIEPSAIADVPSARDMKHVVAVHVRLGDFPQEMRVSLGWYKEIIEELKSILGSDIDIQLFSDGSNGELKQLLSIPGVRRVYYGNALADIVAISRCGLLVGSYSTFSGWGAFLGQVPSIFNKIGFEGTLRDKNMMCITGNSVKLPNAFKTQVKAVFEKE